MTNNYESNAAALDAAHDEANIWATIYSPEVAREEISSYLLGALMAATPPDVFGAILRDAERFAGQPLDYREHGPEVWQ